MCRDHQDRELWPPQEPVADMHQGLAWALVIVALLVLGNILLVIAVLVNTLAR